MSQYVLETHLLTRRFGALTAVDQLELKVPQGSVYGFLGPNGAGKTTTIRMLLGLIRPDGGQVRLFGTPLRQQRAALLKRVGCLVEMPSLYPHLTGRENLEVFRRLLAVGRANLDRALQIVGLQEAADREVRHYSLGMRQRLGLAVALLPDPELLILDEPTNGLDPAGIHEMRELIVELAEHNGLTIFLSSHLLNEIELMATHIGIIQKGRLVFQGTKDELQSRLAESMSLGVDQPENATRLLSQAGWSVQRNGNQRLSVTVNGSSDAAMINAQLVRAGINVYHLSLQRPSLEDIFLKLTGER